MTQPLDLEDIRPQLNEMRDVVTQTMQTFLDNCPEGFEATDVGDAVVEVCSDEMLALYQARAERDALYRGLQAAQAETEKLRAELAEEQGVNKHLVEKHAATLTATDEWMDERAQLLAEQERLRARVGELLQDGALAALYAAGVDNWDGYDDALSSLD